MVEMTLEAFQEMKRSERQKFLASIMGTPLYFKLLQAEKDLQIEEEVLNKPPEKPPEPKKKPSARGGSGSPPKMKGKAAVNRKKEPPEQLPPGVTPATVRTKYTEITEADMEAIFFDITNGMSIQSACLHHGVSPDSFYRWRRKADEGIPAYKDVMDKLEIMFQLQRGVLEAVVYQAARTDPKLALEILERRYTDWGKRQPTAGPSEQHAMNIRVNVSRATPEPAPEEDDE